MSAESDHTRGEYDYTAGSYIGEDRPPQPAGGIATATVRREVGGYLLGLAFAVILTIASFWVGRTTLVYGPSLAVGLLVLAVAQMGVHLIFFLHITTDPDNTNNVLALAFGVLMVCLVVFGSIWVMTHLNQNMTSPMMDRAMHVES
jgi:cytochrome o ubiquinol oxidase subunit IV